MLHILPLSQGSFARLKEVFENARDYGDRHVVGEAKEGIEADELGSDPLIDKYHQGSEMPVGVEDDGLTSEGTWVFFQYSCKVLSPK